jgi:hypothetical protein
VSVSERVKVRREAVPKAMLKIATSVSISGVWATPEALRDPFQDARRQERRVSWRNLLCW